MFVRNVTTSVSTEFTLNVLKSFRPVRVTSFRPQPYVPFDKRIATRAFQSLLKIVSPPRIRDYHRTVYFRYRKKRKEKHDRTHIHGFAGYNRSRRNGAPRDSEECDEPTRRDRRNSKLDVRSLARSPTPHARLIRASGGPTEKKGPVWIARFRRRSRRVSRDRTERERDLLSGRTATVSPERYQHRPVVVHRLYQYYA